MNEIVKSIVERRSVRKYSDKMPSKELINEVIKCGLYAPSGRNFQGVKIIAVTNKEKRDEISELNRTIGGWAEGFDPFYGAPVIMVVLGNMNRKTRVYDGSLVLSNMMLAAHSLNLGSCWIHRARNVFELDEYKEFLKEQGVEGEYEGIAFLALGRMAGELPEAEPRKENRIFWVE